jgi:threonine/homoserine/homoserine lactone efflux protein
LLAKARPEDQNTPPPATSSAVRDGILIVILNPNVAVFFIALFSQVIGPDTGLVARSGYAATAWFIDSAWYLIVAWLFSTPRWLGLLQRNSVWFERLFGVILLALAIRLLLESLA